MANVKGRVKAPKSASSRRGRGNPKQSLTGVKKSTNSAKNVKEFNVPRKAGDLTALQQVLMQNEPIDFDKCTEKLLKLSQPPKEPKKRARRSKPKVDNLPRFTTKSGRLVGPRTKDSLKMIDTILKGELMIEIELPTKRVEKTAATNVSNNNEMGIDNQNGTTLQLTEDNKKKSEHKSNKSIPENGNSGIQTRSKLTLPIKYEEKEDKRKKISKTTDKKSKNDERKNNLFRSNRRKYLSSIT